MEEFFTGGARKIFGSCRAVQKPARLSKELSGRACQLGILQARADLTVVSYLMIKTVLGKYTARILLDARVIVPAGKDARGNPVFDALERVAPWSGSVRIYTCRLFKL